MVKIKWKKIVQFKWFKRLYVLYIFGFIINSRLSLPFFFNFFIAEKTFFEKDVVGILLPTYLYSAALAMIPVLGFIEILQCNVFIIIMILTGIIAESLYIWTNSSMEIEVAQAFYGCMTAAETAYFVSIYAHSDIKNIQMRTSCIRAFPLIGKLIASYFAQLFYSLDALNYKELHYFNLAAFILSAMLYIFLPPIESKLPIEEPEKNSKIPKVYTRFSKSFPNKYVIKWTIWSILSVCGYSQFSIYIQPLWGFIQKTNGSFIYNGVLEGTYAVFALVATILAGFTSFDWKYKGDLILCVCSLLQGFMLLLISQVTNIVLNSLFYLILGFIYHFIATILYAEIAKLLSEGSVGFVFSFINLIGWSLGSAMVCLINSSVGLELASYQDLFMIYGFYHVGIGILFILIGLTYWFAKHTYPI